MQPDKTLADCGSMEKVTLPTPPRESLSKYISSLLIPWGKKKRLHKPHLFRQTTDERKRKCLSGEERFITKPASVSLTCEIASLGEWVCLEALAMMLDRQRHKWGPSGSRRAVGHNCTRRRGTKKEGDNRKLCPFRHLVPSCPDKEEGNALGFLLWFPTPLPPQTTPNQLDTPILIFQSLRETTMSFYMKVPVGSQTTLQKLAIWALWGLGTACIFKRPWNRFILDHLNHPTLSFIPCATQAWSCLASEIWWNLED